MQLARVIGVVVATCKSPKLAGGKLLLVEPVTADGDSAGSPFLAVDAVGAGPGERVLVVIEGRAAGSALGRKTAPVDAAIVGIVDEVSIQ
jgi:ethanolamine utilization protein EutN